MARSPRVHFEGAISHAMSRGNRGQLIFLDQSDRAEFLEVLHQMKQRFTFTLFAYCLMSNHFHLLIRVTKYPLAAIMQGLLCRYAGYFNARYRITGHLFQSRYKALLCGEDAYFLELLRYIHLNPVRAGLVTSPEGWRWSSHLDYVQDRADGFVDTGFPLSMFGAKGLPDREAYALFIADGLTLEDNFPLAAEGAEKGQRRAERNEHAAGLEPIAEPETRELERLAGSVADANGIRIEALRGNSRRRSISSARHAFIRQAVSCGFRSVEIAAFLHASPPLVSKALRAVKQVNT